MAPLEEVTDVHIGGVLAVEQLEELAVATQEAQARQQLVESPLLPQLSGHLLQATATWLRLQQTDLTDKAVEARQAVLFLLRTLRNVCAAGQAATQLLVSNGALMDASQLVRQLIHLGPMDVQVLKVAVQLLANATSSAADTAVWDLCWPVTFQALAQCTQLEDVKGPLCMALYNCCLRSETASLAFCTPEGLPIFQNLLDSLSGPQEHSQTHLELLVGLLAWERGLLQELMGAASAPVPVPVPLPSLRSWHATLLLLLADTISNVPQRLPLKGLRRPEASAIFTLSLVEQIGQAQSSSTSSVVLEAALQVLRALAALDVSERKDSMLVLVRHGLVPTILAMLAALGPVPSRRSDRHAPPLPPLSDKLAIDAYRTEQPYKGYRSDLVAVLANAAHRRADVQHQMEDLGGVELMLAQCQVDEESPFVREWALWGIRNLCEASPSIRERILDLQVVDTVESPELHAAGLHLQHDSSTGKISLLRNS